MLGHGLVALLLVAHAVPDSCEAAIQERIESELATISAGMAVYIQTPEDERSDQQRGLLEATMALLDDRDRPVASTDLDILDTALTYLSDEAVWDRADDRDCGEADTSWSIFCALLRASVDVTGRYQHRRTALQEVRFIIEARSEGRDYAHRMMDYNNDPATSFADARSAISEARDVVAARLAAQCPAASED